MFRLLEILEYKSIWLKQHQNKLYEKYERKLAELVRQVERKEFNRLNPAKELIVKWEQEIAYAEKEPLYDEGFVDYPDPVKIRRDINRLQKDLRGSEINNFGDIKPNVYQYFEKYHNVFIKDGYLRYLSSSLPEDHNTALVNFWNDVK